jgi:hypothetical protein
MAFSAEAQDVSILRDAFPAPQESDVCAGESAYSRALCPLCPVTVYDPDGEAVVPLIWT